MWSRAELKTKAKAVLKKSYWKAFLVSLVIVFVGGSNNAGGVRLNFNERNWQSGQSNFNNEAMTGVIIGIILIALVVIIAISLLRIFLGYILEVGGRKYFIGAAQDNSDMNSIGFGFDKTRYFKIIKAMFYKGVLTFLWTLLLIIPGIVKSYAYRMVPYILADNPNIGTKRAVELSNEMTRGHKFNMWVLDLSFLGWYFLGALVLGLGTYFVKPYDDSTKAELYLVLRENAIKNGMCTWEELNLRNENILS